MMGSLFVSRLFANKSFKDSTTYETASALQDCGASTHAVFVYPRVVLHDGRMWFPNLFESGGKCRYVGVVPRTKVITERNCQEIQSVDFWHCHNDK